MPTLGKTPRSSPEGNTEPLDVPPSHRSRAWCVTYNNWRDHQPDAWDKIQLLGDYGCIAPEEGEQNGTPHIQGYLYFENKKQKGKLIKDFPKASFRPAFGSAEQNRTYIFGNYTKGDKFKPLNPEAIEWGTMPKQGKRTDLDEIKQEILDGKSVDEIVLETPMVFHQYGRTLERIEQIVLRKQYRKEMTKGFWYFGKTGVGKSKKCFEGYDPETFYVKNLNEDFWDGYRGQETVILNEFRGQIPFSEMLDLCDWTPKFVKIKGKPAVPFLAKTIIVTSALSPQEIYHRSLEHNDKMEQFTRRFEIIEM